MVKYHKKFFPTFDNDFYFLLDEDCGVPKICKKSYSYDGFLRLDQDRAIAARWAGLAVQNLAGSLKSYRDISLLHSLTK